MKGSKVCIEHGQGMATALAEETAIIMMKIDNGYYHRKKKDRDDDDERVVVLVVATGWLGISFVQPPRPESSAWRRSFN